MLWNASIVGPDETPWEGGVYQLKMTFTEEYPDKPPRVRFTSEMFHPNGAQRCSNLWPLALLVFG